MRVVAVLYDSRDLTSRSKKFLKEEGWLNEDDDFYWLTMDEILEGLDDCEQAGGVIPEGWWEASGFTREQRANLEKLWSVGNGNVEARWEVA